LKRGPAEFAAVLGSFVLRPGLSRPLLAESANLFGFLTLCHQKSYVLSCNWQLSFGTLIALIAWLFVPACLRPAAIERFIRSWKGWQSNELVSDYSTGK
jgi:hypothetical protein